VVLFDFNAAIGRPAHRAGGAFDTAEALLAEMDRLGIGEALVHHIVASEVDIVRGNQALLECLDGHDRLHPCWVMAPPTLDDLPPPTVWAQQAVNAGVRAVRLLPAHSLYTVADWCLVPLLEVLRRIRVPVLLDFGPHHWSQRVIPWQDIRAICDRYQDIPLVVTGVTCGATRDMVACLHRVQNLHVELSAFSLPEGLRLLVEDGLGDRLLFGTGMPSRAPECSAGELLYSGLPETNMAAVASGNARRVLRLEGKGPAVPLPQLESKARIIDMHGHYGSWEQTLTTVKTPDAIVKAMDRAQVDAFIGSSFMAIHGEMRMGNAETAAIVKAHPDRLYGYCAINPHYPDEIEAELRHCFEDAVGFVGFKLHCGLHDVDLLHPAYESALAYADAHALPVLVHGGGDGGTWREAAESYPNAPFILAHGCAWDGVSAFPYDFVGEVPNVYIDVAGSAAHRGALRALVDRVGVDKVLYGSDFPMFDFGYEAGRVVLSDLDESAKAAVCGGNALGLFNGLLSS
jgi:predicted TIM-barrel fold metal-dependent hydrolase